MDLQTVILLLNTVTGGPYAIGRVENRKSWKITKPQVDPIDTHKNKTICMI